jgi:hypothetical protein
VLSPGDAGQFVLHYHQERNHHGLDNKLIRPEFNPLPSTGSIRRHKRLAGQLNYHYREAAWEVTFEFLHSTSKFAAYLERALCFLSCSFSGTASSDLGAKAKPARHIWSASLSLFFFCKVCP